MKKYIINGQNINEMAFAAASQGSKVLIEKDEKSSFYIAHLDDSVAIPESIKALEMVNSAKSTVKTNRKFLDLRLCVEIPESVNKKEVEDALCDKISQTLKALIDKKND